MVGSIGFAGLTSQAALLTATFFAGFIVLGIQIGINVVGAMLYPTSLRANGSGWQLGLGRIGSIVGPLAGRFVRRPSGPAALHVVGAALRRRRRRLLRHPCAQHRAAQGASGIGARRSRRLVIPGPSICEEPGIRIPAWVHILPGQCLWIADSPPTKSAVADFALCCRTREHPSSVAIRNGGAVKTARSRAAPGSRFSPNSRIERIRSGSGRSEKLNSPMKVLNRPASAAARIFAATVSGEPMKTSSCFEQIIGIEHVPHDLGRAGLAAADEHLGKGGHALLEAFARLRRRQKALVGAAGAEERSVERLAGRSRRHSRPSYRRCSACAASRHAASFPETCDSAARHRRADRPENSRD